MRRFLCLLLALLLCAGLFVLPAAAASRETATVDFLKVGKADCIVIRHSGQVYMIDTATENKADDMLDYLDDNGIDRIDILFLTHYDKDHIGGAPELLDSVEIGQIYTTAYIAKESNEIDALQQAAEDVGLDPVPVTKLTELSENGLTFTLLPPMRNDYESNDSSLVIRMTYGDTAMLFAGDIEQTRIGDLIASGAELSADLLKVPHHGAYDDGTDALIAAVNAQYAVITCSKDEKEDDDTVQALEDAGTEVYLTRHGMVTAVTDGRTLTVIQD